MKKLHPALALFSELFDAAASKDNPDLPTHYVPRTWFMQQCRKRGIDCPDGFIEGMEWEEKIGLRNHVRKTLAKFRKQHGLKMTPMERGSLRLERQMKKAGRL